MLKGVGVMTVITKDKLFELYKINKLTDKEIAKMYNVDRTYIVHLRKRYKIEPNNLLMMKSLEAVIQQLEHRGVAVKNLKEKDKTSTYDLLVNDKVRIEVMASSKLVCNSHFKFSFTYREELNPKESSYRIQLNNKRFRKLFRKTCDFIVFCGFNGENTLFWVIPSNELKDDLQCLSLRPYSKTSKYNKYLDAWDLIISQCKKSTN